MRLYALAQGILLPPALDKKAHKGSPSITEGIPMVTQVKNLSQGIRLLSPGAVLGLQVRLLELDEEIVGYQRDPRRAVAKIKSIAQAMEAGKMFPSGTVAIDGKDLFIVDGLKRALAAVMVRKSFRAELRPMTEAQQRQLFHDQGKGQSVSRSHAVLTGQGPIAEYVMDVLTAPDTPWEGLVTENGRAKTLSPAGLEMLVAVYVTGNFVSSTDLVKLEDRTDLKARDADELAGWLRAFGTPATNPVAFGWIQRRAITEAATIIFRARPRDPGDARRWARVMPLFRFEAHLHLKRGELREALLRHWNKRLAPSRKIDPTWTGR